MVPFPVTPSRPPQTFMLSEHFTIEEATTSDTAARKGIDNSHPSADVVSNAVRTAAKLEKVRALLNSPIHINSWIRSLALNNLLGSKPTSQHVSGEAVDFTASQFGTPLDICRLLISYKELVRWDQLILEHTWIHISWKATPNAIQRGEVLSLLSSNRFAVGLTDAEGKPY